LYYYHDRKGVDLKEVVVYWGCASKASLGAKEPEKVLLRHSVGKNPSECQYLRCPAYKDSLRNTFAMLSLWGFSLTLDRKHQLMKTDLSQEFFDSAIVVRSIDVGLVTIVQSYLFFTEEEGMEISTTPAYLEENDFVTKTTVIPGRMDISSWFRVIEVAFHFNKNSEEIDIKLDDALIYMKFHTDKRIKFVRYECTDRLMEMSNQCTQTREYKGVAKKLSYYYDLFNRSKIRKKILKEIKKNIY
jgi:hypothetical protein